jgi:D-lactate dehydrogenase
MEIYQGLKKVIPPEKILVRPVDRYGFASDASFYRLIPQAVVQPSTLDEIRSLLVYSHEEKVPLTFRAAGTSLSGQAVTDGILVDISRHWRSYEISDDGKHVRFQPGVRAGFLNDVLNRKHKRRIGPDPASIQSAMMGGILANNGGGMSCGVKENSYHTLEAMTVILANGLALDSSDPNAREKLWTQTPHIAQGLLDLRSQILSQPGLASRIRQKYSIKNTTGYSLNAFVDFDDPLDILCHLIIGSEGTLGFIAEAALQTFPVPPFSVTELLLFPSVQSGCQSIQPLRDSGAEAIEMMDRFALRSVEHLKGVAEILGSLPDDTFALLTEYACDRPEDLEATIERANRFCRSLPLLRPPDFTADPGRRAALWKIRKGLFTSASAMRPAGTTALIEDMAFALPKLGDVITDMKRLLHYHGYPEAVFWGHGMDGNVHFVLAQSFNSQTDVERYDRFMQDVVDLAISRYDGSLKAEHGTGRNMAPFVEKEWGPTGYRIMQDLKRLLDPENLLNPGVIINPDPHAHIQFTKTIPAIDPRLDPCNECGFCESSCPSADLTLSPRRRISVQREITRLQESGENLDLLSSLIQEYQYSGLDTCAVDGMCAINCPVQINTGTYVKQRRAQAISQRGEEISLVISQKFPIVEDTLRLGVGVAHLAASVIGNKPIVGLTNLAEQAVRRRLPKWNASVPRAHRRRLPRTNRLRAQFVYFPSCIVRVMGTSGKGKTSLIDTILTLSGRAGIQLWIPPDSRGNCCGMPFSTKGYHKAYLKTLHNTLEKFWAWSEEGRLPVVIDASSCAYTLRSCGEALQGQDHDRWEKMKILDPIEYFHDDLLPALPVKKLNRSVVLHPNCASRKLELEAKLESIAKACAERVTIPLALKCCGFAGDRGLLFPELTASATHTEAQEVLSDVYDGYYSSNLTCEMGMEMATGKPYQSIALLMEEASRGTYRPYQTNMNFPLDPDSNKR